MEWVLALHKGDGEDAGARWPSASVWWVGDVGERSVWSPAGMRGPFSAMGICSQPCELYLAMDRSSTLHPPCAGPARAIRAIDGGPWGDDLAVPTTSSPGPGVRPGRARRSGIVAPSAHRCGSATT